MTDVSKMSDWELDAMLAAALGHGLDAPCSPNDDGSHTVREHYESPDYSSDGNAMLSLNEEMRARYWFLTLESGDDGHTATFTTAGEQEGSTVSWVSENTLLARAVAEAAYLALMSEVKA